MRHRTSARWLLPSAILLAVACGPPMIDREGRRVFNPAYRRFLEGPGRAEWQRPEEVLDALEIQPGFVVADVGAGGGYFAERLAKRVGPRGHVLATDVQDEMIEALQARVAERSLDNVTVVRAGFDDPTLPADCCDLVLFSAVYKEIRDREAYMRRLAPALRPGGRVAILGFRPDAPGMGPPRDVRLSAETVASELAAAGYVLLDSHGFLPRQHFLVFGLEAAPSGASARGGSAARR
jgi:SAM-dependent methyltransferase